MCEAMASSAHPDTWASDAVIRGAFEQIGATGVHALRATSRLLEQVVAVAGALEHAQHQFLDSFFVKAAEHQVRDFGVPGPRRGLIQLRCALRLRLRRAGNQGGVAGDLLSSP
jgi:hypothetical protein